MFRFSNILEGNNANDDDDDGFDTEEFDSDISDESPTSEPVQTEYNTEYTTQPVVRIHALGTALHYPYLVIIRHSMHSKPRAAWVHSCTALHTLHIYDSR